MANNIYTVEDLVNQDNIYIRKLDTKVLQDFFIQYICNNVYIFNLSNNDNIRLLFKESQFCHVIGIASIYCREKKNRIILIFRLMECS